MASPFTNIRFQTSALDNNTRTLLLIKRFILSKKCHFIFLCTLWVVQSFYVANKCEREIKNKLLTWCNVVMYFFNFQLDKFNEIVLQDKSQKKFLISEEEKKSASYRICSVMRFVMWNHREKFILQSFASRKALCGIETKYSDLSWSKFHQNEAYKFTYIWTVCQNPKYF